MEIEKNSVKDVLEDEIAFNSKGEPYLVDMCNFIDKLLRTNPKIYDGWMDTASFWRNAFLYDKIKEKYEAQEILHMTLDKFFTGERKWYFRKYPDFDIYIKLVIRSLVFQILLDSEKFTDNELLFEDEEISIFDTIPEEKLEEIIAKIDFKEFVDYANLTLEKSNDTDAHLVFICMLEGNDKNKEIASELGITVDEVVNIKKRLERKLLPLFIDFYHSRKK